MIKASCIILFILVSIQAEDSSCPEQFLSIGKLCYYFSDVQVNWEEAGGVCKGIGSFINETIIPAVLDFGSTRENQLLLTEVYNQSQEDWLGDNNSGDDWFGDNQSQDYWLGGKRIQRKWKWVSQDNVDIDLLANYWANDQPSTDGKCIKATASLNKTLIATEDCSTKLKVICQVLPKHYGFRDIGNHKYYFSEKNDKEKLDWEGARNVCQAIVPPQDFDYVDLAILTDDTDQQLMQIIAQQSDNATWLGGLNNGPKRADGRHSYAWLDGRAIEETSYFWDDEEMWYYRRERVVYAMVISSAGHPRAVLKTTKGLGYLNLSFVCQAYKNLTSNLG